MAASADSPAAEAALSSGPNTKPFATNATVARTAAGTYQVDFPVRANTTCYYQATARSGPAFIVAQGQPQPGRAIVRTFAAVGATAADAAFYITAQCASPVASTTG